VALELSHRVAGPLYRMEKELDEIIAGNKSAPIKLRKKDEFKILADKINKLIAK
jgi:signal transduction histidine kinase